MSYGPELSTYGIEAMTSEVAAELEAAAAPDAPNVTVTIQGFDFDGCGAPGCLNMAPCPAHQPRAWRELGTRKQRGAIK